MLSFSRSENEDTHSQRAGNSFDSTSSCHIQSTESNSQPSIHVVLNINAPANTGKLRAGACLGALATGASVMAIAETNLVFLGATCAGIAACIPVAGWVAIGVAGLILGGISLAILLKKRPNCLKAIAAFGAATIAAAALALSGNMAAALGVTAAGIAAAIPVGGWIALGIAGLVIGGIAIAILIRRNGVPRELNTVYSVYEGLTKNNKIAAAALTAIAITVALLKTATLVVVGGFIASGGWAIIPAAALALAVCKVWANRAILKKYFEQEPETRESVPKALWRIIWSNNAQLKANDTDLDPSQDSSHISSYNPDSREYNV